MQCPYFKNAISDLFFIRSINIKPPSRPSPTGEGGNFSFSPLGEIRKGVIGIKFLEDLFFQQVADLCQKNFFFGYSRRS